MGIFANIFTWWNGSTFGTWVGLRGKDQVGEDALGNLYFQGGADMHGRPRRWVIYKGSNDSSRVPPEWFSWLHHHVYDVPDQSLPAPRRWEKPAVPNMTGPALSFRPADSLEQCARRAAATGDYDPWHPHDACA